MTYQQCLDWLFSQLPIYQRTGSIAYKADIGNIIQATEKLGNPHQNFKSIHIAGTNGKGSTSHLLASVLQEAGYKTGLYTSPHLKDFRERIRINGEMIKQESVIQFITDNKDWFSQIGMSFFEMTVALAFHHFAKEKVDIAIIEVGLGGRLDSTNIIQPELSIITNIGLDHTELLGDSIEKIAREKGGIIKPSTPVLIGRKQHQTEAIFDEIAQDNHSKLYYSENCDIESDLKGNYQNENKNTAYTAIKILRTQAWNILDKYIENGFKNVQKNTSLLGRWMTLGQSPSIICDTGHNEDGVKLIVEQIKKTNYNELHIVFGVVNDKSIDGILKLLPKKAQYYFCQAQIPRAMHVDLLFTKVQEHQLTGNCFKSVADALKSARSVAKENDLIFIGGSTFVVAEII
ncbi:MAG: tetrahydrofolate synthase [Crocinitomicaceae bacterium]|nr:tetrahydrofolate synthase [Crocinitomicaceae bacterium]